MATAANSGNDRPLRTAGCGRDEQRRLTVLAQTADLRDPVGDAAFQLDGRLAADAVRGQRGSLPRPQRR